MGGALRKSSFKHDWQEQNNLLALYIKLIVITANGEYNIK